MQCMKLDRVSRGINQDNIQKKNFTQVIANYTFLKCVSIRIQHDTTISNTW